MHRKINYSPSYIPAPTIKSLPQNPQVGNQAFKRVLWGQPQQQPETLLLVEVSTDKGVREVEGSNMGQEADAMLKVSEMKHLQEMAKRGVWSWV